MLSAEMQSDFFSELPSSIDYNGHTIDIHKRYANQFVGDEFPTITLMYYNSGVVNYIYLNYVKKYTDTSSETFTYNDSEYDLEVLEPNNIDQVMGYVDGTYGVVDDDYYDLVVTGDEGTLVFNQDLDEGTKFTVTYSHDKISAEYGGEFSDFVQIDIYTKDIKEGDDYINGILLNKEIVRNLEKTIRFGIDNPNYVIRSVSSSNDLTNISGEQYVYRRQFDVEIAYNDTFIEYHDKLEEVNYTLNTQVI